MKTIPHRRRILEHGYHVKNSVLSSKNKKEPKMETHKMLGIIGSIVLFVGVFAPIVSAPIMGDMNYFHNGRGDGVIILVLAGASFCLVLAEKYKGLWLTSIGSIVTMAITFVMFQKRLSDLRTKMDAELSGNAFKGFADMAVNSVQLQWGWAVLIVGVGLLFASASMAQKDQKPQGRIMRLDEIKCANCGAIYDQSFKGSLCKCGRILG